MMLKVYVAVVAVMAAAAAMAVSITVHTSTAPHAYTLVLLAVLLALTEYLQLRHYHYKGHGATLNLMDGVLAPLIYVASGAESMLICIAALLVADRLRNTEPIKMVFNVAQWTLAAALGIVVLHALRGSDVRSELAVGALVVAILTMSVVNQAAMSIVLGLASRAAGDSPTRGQFIDGLTGRLLSNGAGLVAGLSITASYLWSPWLLALGVVVVVGLAAAGRANAALRTDSHRLEGLQRATHALATSLEVRQALPIFLAEVQVGFEVQEAQLVLAGRDGPTVHTCRSGLTGGYRVCAGPSELAEVLSPKMSEPAHIEIGTGDDEVRSALARTGHQRLLAAPLRSGSDTIGMLFLFDRIGMEGFEAGELSVAAALARELVGFLERVDLLREIDEERRKLTDILESTSDGILTIDAEGQVTSWNAGLAAITGYSAEEMVGTRHFGLLRPRDTGGRDILIERWLDIIDSATGLPTEMQVVGAEGQALWLSCSYSRIPAAEGRRDVLVVVARNITQARELERLKDDFVAVVSHELRTPLVPIKGWAQTLINRGERLSDAQRRTAVQSILAQAQKLESLVLNILEASRIEAGRADGDGVSDVAAIAMRIVEETLAARPDRVVRVGPPAVPCQVRGSSVWVERAVSNLVANAVKYSPDDQPVDVAISVEGDDVVVAVTDRGPGIPVDAQERIFERFERLEETRTQTGTGLGLYITRRLARAMGGDVTVSSVPGAGSTFLLRLPSAPVTRLPEQRSLDDGERDGTVVNLH